MYNYGKYGLNISGRNKIEDLVSEIIKYFNFVEEPNIYNWTEVKKAMEQFEIEFEFDVKITEEQNSMLGSFEWFSKETLTLKYNVISDGKRRFLQFEISEPNSDTDKRQYIKLLRTIFWEFWDVLRLRTGINDDDPNDSNYSKFDVIICSKADYSLFSRAMILPRDEFIKRVREYYYAHNEKLPGAYYLCQDFFVDPAEITARMRDLDIIE